MLHLFNAIAESFNAFVAVLFMIFALCGVGFSFGVVLAIIKKVFAFVVRTWSIYMEKKETAKAEKDTKELAVLVERLRAMGVVVGNVESKTETEREEKANAHITNALNRIDEVLSETKAETKETKKADNLAPVVPMNTEKKEKKAEIKTESTKGDGKYEGLDVPVSPKRADFATDEEFKTAYSKFNNSIYRIRTKFLKGLENGMTREEANVYANGGKVETKKENTEKKESKAEKVETKTEKGKKETKTTKKAEIKTAKEEPTETKKEVTPAIRSGLIKALDKMVGESKVVVSGVSVSVKGEDKKVVAISNNGGLTLHTDVDNVPLNNFISTAKVNAIFEYLNTNGCKEVETKTETKAENKKDVVSEISALIKGKRHKFETEQELKVAGSIFHFDELCKMDGDIILKYHVMSKGKALDKMMALIGNAKTNVEFCKLILDKLNDDKKYIAEHKTA